MDTGNYSKNLYEEKFCEAKTIIESESETLKPMGRSGPLLVRMLVALSQTRVHIHIESRIQLDQAAVDIRNCKRNAYLTRCKLFDAGNKRNGKIYLNGYIKESLEYASIAEDNEGRIKGNMRYMTIKIPFECAAKIEYYIPPSIRKEAGLMPVELLGAVGRSDETSPVQWEDKTCSLPQGVSNADRIYCEVEDVRIVEADMMKFGKNSEKNQFYEHTFDSVVEQLSVSITFTLLQKQLVNFPKYSSYSGQY